MAHGKKEVGHGLAMCTCVGIARIGLADGRRVGNKPARVDGDQSRADLEAGEAGGTERRGGPQSRGEVMGSPKNCSKSGWGARGPGPGGGGGASGRGRPGSGKRASWAARGGGVPP